VVHLPDAGTNHWEEVTITSIGYREKKYRQLDNRDGVIRLERNFSLMDTVQIINFICRTIHCGSFCSSYTINQNQFPDTRPATANFISVYPVPARRSSVIHIKMTEPCSGIVQVLNASGQVMQTQAVQPEQSLVCSLQLGQLGAGTYFIRLENETNHKVQVQKILIQ
jgi:hypothetical protein